MLQPEPIPCPPCPWRRDTRLTLTGRQVLAMRGSCGTRGQEAGLTARMVACVLGDQQRPCAGWLAAHGADHLPARILVATGRLRSAALRPGPGWPDIFTDLDELAQAHTGKSLDELTPSELEPDVDVYDPATGRARRMKDMCSTCILRPGDLMHLGSENLRRFLAQARDSESFVICHQTLPGMSDPQLPPAMCRGFFDRYDTAAVRIAQSRGLDDIDTPPPAHNPTTGTTPD